MSRDVPIDEEMFRRPEVRALANDPSVNLLCSRCSAPLEILRMSAGSKDEQGRFPIHLVRCSNDERHFCVSFHSFRMDFDRIVADAREDDRGAGTSAGGSDEPDDT